MDLRDVKEFLKDSFSYIFFIACIFFICVYIVGIEQVVGPSMTPTYLNGDILVVDKFSYIFGDVKRNDIVSFSNSTSKYLIKRVIGLPGDKVEFKNNELYINDRLFIEDYLSDESITHDFTFDTLGVSVVPEGSYFVLGDNRTNSQDSRDPKIGFVKKEDIVGRVWFKLWSK